MCLCVYTYLCWVVEFVINASDLWVSWWPRGRWRSGGRGCCSCLLVVMTDLETERLWGQADIQAWSWNRGYRFGRLFAAILSRSVELPLLTPLVTRCDSSATVTGEQYYLACGRPAVDDRSASYLFIWLVADYSPLRVTCHPVAILNKSAKEERQREKRWSF